MEETKDDNAGIGGLFIPGGIMLGMGIGFLMGNIPAGLFIGMGAGFVLFAVVGLFRH